MIVFNQCGNILTDTSVIYSVVDKKRIVAHNPRESARLFMKML